MSKVIDVLELYGIDTAQYSERFLYQESGLDVSEAEKLREILAKPVKKRGATLPVWFDVNGDACLSGYVPEPTRKKNEYHNDYMNRLDKWRAEVEKNAANRAYIVVSSANGIGKIYVL